MTQDTNTEPELGPRDPNERWGYSSPMNLYYGSPAETGYEKVGEVDPCESYEFDTLVVFRRLSDGTLWWTADAGCSCPCPFEDNTDADMEPLTQGTFDAFKDALRKHSAYRMGETHPDKIELERTVREALR